MEMVSLIWFWVDLSVLRLLFCVGPSMEPTPPIIYTTTKSRFRSTCRSIAGGVDFTERVSDLFVARTASEGFTKMASSLCLRTRIMMNIFILL